MLKLLSLFGLAWNYRGWIAACVCAWALLVGVFTTSGTARWIAGSLLLAITVDRLRLRLLSKRLDVLAETEAAMLLVLAVYSLVLAAGGPASPLHALVYACAAFLGASERLGVMALALALSGVLEWQLAPDTASWHVALLSFFAGGGAALFRAELMRQRREHRRRVEEEVLALREDARDFRLIGATLAAPSRVRSREEEEQKLAQGSVETIRQGHYYLLDLLKRSLELRTAILLWLDEDGTRLKIKEVVSDSDSIAESPLAATHGAPGAIVRNRISLNLTKTSDMILPYYRLPQTGGAFLGVPVLEDGHVRGVLCADRAGERSFDGRDEHLLRGAAQQVLRIVQTERVVCTVERSKYETERFLQASKKLASALTLEQVYDQALEAARAIVDFDFAAFTLFERERRRHRVCRIAWPTHEGGQEIEGLEYRDNAGLVAMAVKNKHPLHGDQEEGNERVVFTARVKLPGMKSVLVIPLIVKDEAIGALVLAAARPSHFPKETADRLGVIANQVAVSVENAKMYRHMEEMATTDGLTGLCNHRTMHERLGGMLERATRFDTQVAFLLCDIDHFKSINDTYGHPVGDLVLRRVGRLLNETIRKIDLCARYGGEEFGVAMEQTDLEGGRRFAERLREEIERIPFATERGNFHVTLSVGVAVFASDSLRKETLIERADQALYRAKQAGRNRVVAWSDTMRAAS